MTGNIILVGLGGFAGAVARYFATAFLLINEGALPQYGILAVNCVGSFFAGVLLGLPFEAAGPTFRLLFATGFLGAFTTFSAFSADSILMLKNGLYVGALINAALNVILSVGAAALGLFITGAFYGR